MSIITVINFKNRRWLTMVEVCLWIANKRTT